MKLVATKLEMETVGQMSRLVIDNIDAIASDLTVLDSRLLLGNANIDVVALDGTGSLVLVAINLSSDEQLLLKAVEAYSWCLEYPEAVRRLYPAADVSAIRPPRVMFVVERMSDSFHRKVKQLGFPEVDCVEFRHLAIDGAEAVHFDTIVRLRRAALVSTDARASASTPVRDDAGLDLTTGARATSVKLQKLLAADTTSPSASRQDERAVERPLAERPAAVSAPVPAREPGVVVSMMNRAGRHAAARLEEAALAAKQPVMPAVALRSVRGPEPITEPLATTTVEPAAFVSTALEMVVEREPVLAPEPVALAPALELMVVPDPIAVPEPVVATPPMAEPGVSSQPIAVLEPAVATAPVLEAAVAPEPIAALEPFVTAPVLEAAVAPPPIAAPEAIVAIARLLEPVVQAASIAVPDPVAASPLEVAPPVDDSAPVLEHAMEPSTAPEPTMEQPMEPVAVPVIEAGVQSEPVPASEPVVAMAPAPELAVEPQPIAAPAPVVAAPEAPRISFADLSKELLAAQSIERKAAATAKPVPPTRPVEPPVSIKPIKPAAVAVSFADLSKDLLGAPSVRRSQMNGPTPKRFEVPPVEPVKPALDVAPAIDAASGPPLTPEHLVEAATQAVPEPAAELAETSNIKGLPGLKFPGDGVLTRQWMDFLNQMTATK